MLAFPDFASLDFLQKAPGSEKPTRAQVEQAFDEFLEAIERGQCHYVMIQAKDGKTEVFFAGYSFD